LGTKCSRSRPNPDARLGAFSSGPTEGAGARPRRGSVDSATIKPNMTTYIAVDDLSLGNKANACTATLPEEVAIVGVLNQILCNIYRPPSLDLILISFLADPGQLGYT
jgi:hypothetical protein